MAGRVEGKIPHGLLGALLKRLTSPGREVIVGPALGEDAFAAEVDEAVVVASTDPITFATEHIGHYAVNVNANDVATMGARPKWFMATALVPPGTGAKTLARLFSQIDKACVKLGIRLCGGHTEVTSAVTRPVIVGAMMGTVEKRRLIRPGRAGPGDRILMTKRLALEGTSIIARERRREVGRLLGRRGAARARNLLFTPGISVVADAMCAACAAPVKAMHDPTEGGLLWGVTELGLTTACGVEIDLDRVPVYDETRIICEHFRLDPLGLIASGSLLIVVSRRSGGKVMRALGRKGIECTDIGRLLGRKPRGMESGSGRSAGTRGRGKPRRAVRPVLLRGGRRVPFPVIKSDEISKVV